MSTATRARRRADVVDLYGVPMIELHYANLPDWLRVATLHRWRVVDTDEGRDGWFRYARAAVDESNLPSLHRGILRVLIDWHTNGATWVQRPIGRDIARRVGERRDETTTAIGDLEGWGWLRREKVPGSPSRITLLVPIEAPPDRMKQRPDLRGVPPVGKGEARTRANTPPPHQGQHPYPSGPTPPTHQGQHHRGTGAEGPL